METSSSFSAARNQLTTFYVGILFCIIFVFSIFLFVAQNNDYRRIAVQEDFGNTVPHKFTKFQNRIIATQIKDLRRSFLYELIIIDSAILLIGGVASYFFAAHTLKPVNKALENQKDFLADASHELRTPLAAMQTAIEVVLRKEQKSPDVYKETLQQVGGEVKRMHNLIEELLLLSRLDMNQINISFSKIKLSKIVEQVIKNIKGLADVKHIEIIAKLKDVSILGDEERIAQILIILLDNAIKFTPNNGKIFITLNDTPAPQIIVQDTGIGISTKKQKDIFKRFYQGDVSHTGKGAGLGLAIADSIIKLHKGKIIVESEINKGTTFTCIFPKNM